jgi:hypothetical protein
MKSIRLLGYLPEYGDGHCIDNLIDEYTHIFNLNVPKALRCSHTELWFPEGGQWYQDTTNKFLGQCHTSTMRGKDNGVVMRPASVILDNPKRWDYMEIPVNDAEYRKLYDFCAYRASLGIKYGTITFLRFFTPRWNYDPEHPICSGECWYNMRECLDRNNNATLMDALEKVNTPSPTRLYHRIWQCGFVSYSLETGNAVIINR